MTCKKCGHEFCWVCKQDFLTHTSNICAANVLAKVLYEGFFIFNVGILFGVLHPVWYWLKFLLVYILKIMFYNLTYFIIFLLILPILHLCKERESIFANKLKLLWYLMCFSVMAYVAWFDFNYILKNC